MISQLAGWHGQKRRIRVPACCIGIHLKKFGPDVVNGRENLLPEMKLRGESAVAPWK